ncbi:hypothetical protein QBC35DRAFT_123527 [Podospora australis]|uniref:Uncharacterized protein n=1 Tax=Podospora australis TaxID=1536484 RepID=A0AAN6WX69_9PEZI|nr:hypothetical protein QBC35DRAFT_123527 [Podospora australis]
MYRGPSHAPTLRIPLIRILCEVGRAAVHLFFRRHSGTLSSLGAHEAPGSVQGSLTDFQPGPKRRLEPFAVPSSFTFDICYRTPSSNNQANMIHSQPPKKCNIIFVPAVRISAQSLNTRRSHPLLAAFHNTAIRTHDARSCFPANSLPFFYITVCGKGNRRYAIYATNREAVIAHSPASVPNPPTVTPIVGAGLCSCCSRQYWST